TSGALSSPSAAALDHDMARVYVSGSAGTARYLLEATAGSIVLASDANPATAGNTVTLTATIAGMVPHRCRRLRRGRRRGAGMRGHAPRRRGAGVGACDVRCLAVPGN